MNHTQTHPDATGAGVATPGSGDAAGRDATEHPAPSLIRGRRARDRAAARTLLLRKGYLT
ncbi:hypothetical protein ORV05_11490 [Amycolatopsis cynarae]|uniref:Uncharacterized protein n=1 Tax=Amycolatopsis cynarae TaxID=2995223 RepID=A0ABY7BBV2_9PSEU|nr:hypothetical protein [Amycolatopsis sp. HUAS 11-8]WAL68356.1 hypothetical protein ORV05_11490 [Amycolatopsis sp. HUAS 11-8]